MNNKEILHYDIEGFKNITVAIVYFDTENGAKNKLLPFLGRSIIKLTTRSNIEHIAIVIKVPSELIGTQYEDEYNGKDVINGEYILLETTGGCNVTCTDLLKRLQKPSLIDIDKKGDSSWTGQVYIQKILPQYISKVRLSLALNEALKLTNQKSWINSFPSKYVEFRAILSPFPFAKWVNKILGYKKITPAVFCSVFAKYITEFVTGKVDKAESFDMLEALGTNPKDFSHECYSKQLTKMPEILVQYVDGKPIMVNKDIISTPIYK